MTQDTIYALSSGSVPAGVAIIRLSGPRACDAIVALAGRCPAPRLATHMSLRDAHGHLIDDAVVIHFARPKSFTGDDVIEIQCHGSRATVNAILGVLGKMPGLRHAEPGEFTRCAFENGKIDLVGVEGLADLISSETEAQLRLARSELSGQLSNIYDEWARRITQARALIEAELDFSDEQDIPGSVSDRVWVDIGALVVEMETRVDGSGIAEIIRDGFRVVIAGPPNAGKSSLMNALARRDVAIVTDIAGTTRDVLSVDLDLGGYKVVVEDTAGLRETDDVVEREGIRRTHRALDSADLVLWLSESGEIPPESLMALNPMLIMTKADLHDKATIQVGWLLLSVRSNAGFDSLLKQIQSRLDERIGAASSALPIRSRHNDLLRQAIAALRESLGDRPLEIRAEDLRRASHALGRITGRVDVEDLLDVIFKTFCVGK